MQKALVEVLTPGGARNESKIFSTPEPVKTPQKEEDKDCLNSLMQYLCKTVLQLPEDCIIFDQEEVYRTDCDKLNFSCWKQYP